MRAELAYWGKPYQSAAGRTSANVNALGDLVRRCRR
jgi:hypothetical protein